MAQIFSPQEGLTRPLSADGARPHIDIEAGVEEPRWASWARQAAERVRQSAAEAADQAQRVAAEGLERANSVDWNGKVQRVQDNVSSGFETVKDRASEASERLQDSVSHAKDRAKSVDWDEKVKGLQRGLSNTFETVGTSASSAAVAVQERGQSSFEVTREYSRQSVESARNSVDSLQLGDSFTKAKDSVSAAAGAAAGAATGAITHAGERVSSLQAITISPATWAQFAGVFLAGTLFIMLSLTNLPFLLISPHKFAMSFTIGSVMILSSFVIFSGPKAMLTSMSQREKLPFSILYVVGLVGTLWATLFMRSYIFTAIFAVVQAVALLYFMASYLPGGKTAVNACFRLSGRSVRAIVRI
jgi:hypothetical protein